MTLRRLASGFVALSGATIFAQVLGFVIMVVLARRLSTDDIGAYGFALALTGYFSIPVNFGVTTLALRDLAQSPDQARRLMGEVSSLQFAACVIPYTVMIATMGVLVPDADARAIVPIIGLSFVVDGLTFPWVLTGFGRFALLAAARVVGAVVFAVGCLLFVHSGEHAVRDLGWVTLIGAMSTGIITGLAAVLRHGAPEPVLHVRLLFRRWRAGVTLGVMAVMISVYYTADALLLGYLKDTATVGQYNIAYKIPLALIGVVALWGSVLFPHASALAGEGRLKELREQLSLFGSSAMILSLPTVAGALLVGHDLIPRLFGAKYAPAGTPFIWLMVAAAVVFFTLSYGTVGVALHEERNAAVAATFGAVANIVLNLATIPLIGMTGAAIATVTAELVVFVWVYRRLRLRLGPIGLDWSRVARAAAATAVMTAVLLPLDELTVLVRVIIGTAVYVLAAAALRVVHPAELRAALRPGTA